MIIIFYSQQVQYTTNNGKCGICGDSYNGERKNELPDGKYAKGLKITRTYQEASIFEAKVQLTANHRGYFTFKICPATTMDKEVTQECLDNHVLRVQNSSDDFKYIVPNGKSEVFSAFLQLPKGLHCERCVIQWTYTAGNNWGQCEDGRSRVGCGPQETFRACADVKLLKHEIKNDSDVTTFNSENEIIYETTTSSFKSWSTQEPFTSKITSSTPSTKSPLSETISTTSIISVSSNTSFTTTTAPKHYWQPKYTTRSWIHPFTISSTKASFIKPTEEIDNQIESSKRVKYIERPYSNRDSYVNKVNRINQERVCAGVSIWRTLPGIENWCLINCAAGFCPPSHCKCKSKYNI